MTSINILEPAIVWRHFATLLATPRPSKGEAPLRELLAARARAQSLGTQVDAAGNLILRKPATAGYENAPGVILQAHLDMVCQKNSDVDHDFTRDPIAAEIDGDWLIARKTTLGADNGIGVALALAALEAESIAHPALEVLLTVDEEAGMGGAQGLESGLLQGKLMINLDTEDWGEFFLGCAGGIDVNIELPGETRPLPTGWTAHRLAVTGLAGGHSGVDIHLERGNAIKILVRLLDALNEQLGDTWTLSSIDGGSARNALPREATAVFAVAPGQAVTLAQRFQSFGSVISAELADVDPAMRIECSPADAAPSSGLTAPARDRLLAVLRAAPHGVHRMSQRMPGIVETSNNLGIVRLSDGLLTANLMVRSLIQSGARDLAGQIAALFRLAGGRVLLEGEYPGWAPNPDSALLGLFQKVYQAEFGAGPATVKVIHAGLECGLLKAKYPELDIVSFGPDIRGAHAPGERVRIATVGHCWRLLTAVLAAISAD